MMMRSRPRNPDRGTRNRILELSLMFILVAGSGLAWGEKGHGISNEAATYGTPAEMPVFFHEAYPQLVYLGYNPDRWRGAGQSADANNFPDHFLDYEYVAHLELPRDRYAFIDLLASSGTLRRFGIGSTTPGFVPWRIAEMAETLTQEWRLWRQSKPGTVERQAIEQNIIFLSGVLGHFVSDSANPHHASIHYNGWVGIPNPHRYPNDCDAHNRFETQFISREIDAVDVFPQLAAPISRNDYFATALELIRNSQSQIEEIYRIDRDGGFLARRSSGQSRAFAISRLATGASYLRDFWWSAYRNSAAPVPGSR